jgi:hypothetical protein
VLAESCSIPDHPQSRDDPKSWCDFLKGLDGRKDQDIRSPDVSWALNSI